jgi:hypothetical protein
MTRRVCEILRWRIAVICIGVIIGARVHAQSASPECQQSAGDAVDASDGATAGAPGDGDKRIFGIIPNYRTSPTLTNYVPLTTGTKFRLAAEDGFDRGTFILAGLFAAQAQWTQTAPSFGHGVGAYGRYYSAALSDLMLGDFMTEAIYPAAFRQDPRYFRRGVGSVWGRLGYAAGQIVWTHTDAGGAQLNVSELLGNATAVGIANAYYPDDRTLSRNVSRWSLQVAVDMAANILKEFWPDLDRAFGHH